MPASGDAGRGTTEAGTVAPTSSWLTRWDVTWGAFCHYRECRPRVAWRALSCRRRQPLNDNPQIVTLTPELPVAEEMAYMEPVGTFTPTSV